MKVAGVQDLGGLGAKEGPPVSYVYTLPNILPELAPWIAILLLMLVKSNRAPQAWLIWAPLIFVAGARYAFQNATFWDSESWDFLLQVVSASTFGVGTMFLIAPQLKRQHGFLTLLAVLFCLGLASLIFLVLGLDWEGALPQASVFSIFLLIMNAVIVLAMFVASFACRKRYSEMRVLLWSSGGIFLFCILLSLPFAVLPLLFAREEFPWWEVGKALLLTAGLTLVPIQPFVLLSLFSTFFRERLQLLLHRTKPLLPPVIPESSPVGVGN